MIVECYNESVFPTLQTKFLARVINHLSVIVPRLPPTLNLPHGNVLLLHECLVYMNFGVFIAPIEDLHGNKSGDTKDHHLVNISTDILSEEDELFELAEACQQVGQCFLG